MLGTGGQPVRDGRGSAPHLSACSSKTSKLVLRPTAAPAERAENEREVIGNPIRVWTSPDGVGRVMPEAARTGAPSRNFKPGSPLPRIPRRKGSRTGGTVTKRL